MANPIVEAKTTAGDTLSSRLFILLIEYGGAGKLDVGQRLRGDT